MESDQGMTDFKQNHQSWVMSDWWGLGQLTAAKWAWMGGRSQIAMDGLAWMGERKGVGLCR